MFKIGRSSSNSRVPSASAQLSAEQLASGIKIYKFLKWESLNSSYLKDRSMKGHELRYNDEVYKVINDKRTFVEESNIEKCTLTVIDKSSCTKEVLKKHILELSFNQEYQRADDQDNGFINIILDNNDISSKIAVRSNKSYVPLLNSLKDKVLESSKAAVKYRQLMHSYKSTLELADAYNKADAFSSWVKADDGRTIRVINPHKDHLLQVANDMLYSYSKIHNPSRSQIFEIANLSGFNNSDISRCIFNTLVTGIDGLTPDSLEIPNLDEVKAFARMLMLLPPGFISEKHSDVVIKILNKMSGWLKSQNINIQSQETQVEHLIPVLQLYADMVSSLLDNTQLQQMSIANGEISVGVMLRKYRKNLMKGIFKNTKKDNIPSAKKLLGDGLSKEAIKSLKEGLKEISKNIDVPMSIQYWESYIQQSIVRLAQEGSTDFAQVLNRSKHLMLGASGLCLMAIGGGGALSDFKELIKHAGKSIKASGTGSNEWYDTAKYLSSMISEAHGDPEKLNFLLNHLGHLYGSQSKTEWQLVYVILERFFEEAEKIQNEDIINELMRFALERSVYPKYTIEIKKVAVEFLISAASSPVKEIRDLAKKNIKESYPVCKGIDKFPESLLVQMGCIEAARIKQYRDETDSNELLHKAKSKKFPIELKASYLRDRVEEICKDNLIEDSLSAYIPLTGAVSKYSSDRSQFFSLEQRVTLFIEEKKLSGTPTLLIHGNAGAGKSLFGRYIEKKYWSEYEHGGIIPLMVPLPSLQNPSHKAIEQALSEYGFSQEDILHLKIQKHKDQGSVKKLWLPAKNNEKDDSGRFTGVEEQKDSHSPRLLLILDGYDEINGKMNIHNAYETSSWKNIKVIITSRTEYLEKMPKQDLFGKGYEEVFIRPFDEMQIKSFIEKRFNLWDEAGDIRAQSGLNHQNFEDLILGNKDLSSIIEHPFMLEIVMEILPQLKEQKARERIIAMANSEQNYVEPTAEEDFNLGQVTRYDVYDLFLNSWFKREGLRQREMANSLPEDFNPECSAESYAIAVAVFMFKNDIQAIKGDGVNYTRTDVLASEGAKFFGSESKTLSRKASPLKKIGDMRYSFIHKSIQEFLFAKGMLEEIHALALDSTREIKENDILNSDYVQKDSSVLRFVLDGITPKELVVLERVILDTREYTKAGVKSPIVIAAANSATLYVRTMHTQAVISRDWSYTQITGADISGAYFYDMNFTNCNWDNVVARSMVIICSKCDNMDLTNINTGEYANLFGHKSSVNSVALTDKYVFSGAIDEEIRVWDKSSSAFVRVLDTQYSIVDSIYSYGNYLISCGQGSNDLLGSIGIWDIRSLDEPVREIKDPGSEFKFVYAARNYLFSVISIERDAQSGFKVWNIHSGNLEKTLHSQYMVHCVCADDSYVFAASSDFNIRFWELGSWNFAGVLEGHESKVNSIYAYSQYLFSGSSDNTVMIWSIEKKACLKTLTGHDYAVNSVCASDQYVFSGSSDKTIRIWDLASGECLRIFMGHKSNITSLVVSGQHMFSGSADTTVRVWNTDTGSILGQNLGVSNKGEISSTHISHPYIFTCTKEGYLRIYHIDSGRLLKIIENTKDDVAYSIYATDSYVLSGYKDGEIRVYEISSGNYVFSLSGHDNAVMSLSGVGDRIISGSQDSNLRVWNIASGECLEVLEGHRDAVKSVYILGHHIFSCSEDSTVRIWSLDNYSFLGELKGHNGYVNVVASNDKYVFSAAADKKIKKWDLEKSICVKDLTFVNANVNGIFVYGNYLFSCFTDMAIRVWDIESGVCKKVLWGHSSSVMGVHANDTNLISVDDTGMTIVWDISNISDIKMLRAFGRQGWEQPLRFIDNTADSLCGLSEQNQRLFEQHNFKANFKESHSFKSNVSRQDTLQSQNDVLRSELAVMKEQQESQSNALRAELAVMKEQQVGFLAMLRNTLTSSGSSLENPQFSAADSPVTSGSLGANMGMSPSSRNERNGDVSNLSAGLR